jgi:hypothetical protein
MYKYILLLTTCLSLVSCSSEEQSNTTSDQKESNSTTTNDSSIVEPSYPYDSKFNDFAKYIAGSEGTDSSQFKSLESTASWKSYQSSLDVLWKKTNSKLPVIQDWANKELTEVNSEGGTLFYPFSGADFLHADLFFSGHDNIVMMALEPIGNYPDLHQKKKDTTLTPYLNGLKKSMHAILQLSFFRTIAMADDFQSEMDGTLHVLTHFMSRRNHELLFQEKVAILSNGDLTNDLSTVSDTAYIGNRFYFRKNGEDKVKTLTYFAVNIQNTTYHSRGGLVAKGLKDRKDLVKFLKSSNIKTTYLKSASYLLHRPTFSIIRNLILNESEYLLQDDSGIPVQYFDENKWELTFYGNYIKPISLFDERHQEDLKEIYAEKKFTVKTLPFGIGYQYAKGTSNLMKATKK